MFQAPPPEVSEVVVTAPRPLPPVGEAAFSVVKLGPSELQEEPRLDEALRRAPGASLFRRTTSLGANPTTQGLSLRSFAPSGAGRALVTLDGVPQNDPFGGWVIWTALPPESLESAAIVRGAGAGPYGAGALTGTVALEERSTVENRLAGDVSLAERGDSRAAGVGSLHFGRTRLFGFTYLQRAHGWIPVRAGRGAVDAPLSLDAWSGAVRLTAPLGGASVAARLSAYAEERGTGVSGGTAFAQGAAFNLSAAASPSRDRLGWRAQLWVRASDFGQTSFSVAPDRQTATPASAQDTTPALGWGANAAVRGAGARFSWEVGADARFADGETRERFRFMEGEFTRARVAGGRSAVAGLYGEGAWRDGDWLLTAGLRADGWSASDARRQERDRTSGAVTLDDRASDRRGWLPTARAGVRRRLPGPFHVRAAAYAGFRPATLNELHRPFRVGNDITEANPALEPERLYGVDGALGAEGESWRASLGGFWNRLDDAVTNVTVGFGPGVFPRAGFVPEGGTLRERRNAGVIDAVGVEAEGEYDVAPAVSLRVAFAATDAEVDGGSQAPQLTGRRPAQAPRFTATSGFIWRSAGRLTVSGDLRYESERFEDDLNTRVLSPALAMDGRVSWRLRERTFAYAAAENLFDAEVETAETGAGLESFGPPRTFRVGLSIR